MLCEQNFSDLIDILDEFITGEIKKMEFLIRLFLRESPENTREYIKECSK